MALNYNTFQVYPLEIEGITSEYNTKITAVENFVKSDMAATGVTVTDAILSYFVFWFLCQDAAITVTIKTGETAPIAKTVYPSFDKQIQNWNIGVDKLRLLCGITEDEIENLMMTMYGYARKEAIEMLLSGDGITINSKYLSKRSLL